MNEKSAATPPVVSPLGVRKVYRPAGLGALGVRRLLVVGFGLLAATALTPSVGAQAQKPPTEAEERRQQFIDIGAIKAGKQGDWLLVFGKLTAKGVDRFGFDRDHRGKKFAIATLKGPTGFSITHWKIEGWKRHKTFLQGPKLVTDNREITFKYRWNFKPFASVTTRANEDGTLPLLIEDGNGFLDLGFGTTVVSFDAKDWKAAIDMVWALDRIDLEEKKEASQEPKPLPPPR